MLLALLGASCGGCGVERTITITSNPPGAMVTLNDQEIGRTPVTHDFFWYGTYDVELRDDGYKTLKTTGKVWAPWWQVPPIDLVAELAPVRSYDHHFLHYTLARSRQPSPTPWECSCVPSISAASWKAAPPAAPPPGPRCNPIQQPEKRTKPPRHRGAKESKFIRSPGSNLKFQIRNSVPGLPLRLGGSISSIMPRGCGRGRTCCCLLLRFPTGRCFRA